MPNGRRIAIAVHTEYCADLSAAATASAATSATTAAMYATRMFDTSSSTAASIIFAGHSGLYIPVAFFG